MLRINDKEVEITKSTIKFANATYNKVKGYSPSINISFINNNKTGHISFFLDFYLNNSFDNIINKTFIDDPLIKIEYDGLLDIES